MKARITCFISYKIIIFSINKENDDIGSAYCKFSQLGDIQTIFSHFISVLPSAIKTHLLTNQIPRTVQIILN